jgi:hypothetical protein
MIRKTALGLVAVLSVSMSSISNAALPDPNNPEQYDAIVTLPCQIGSLFTARAEIFKCLAKGGATHPNLDNKEVWVKVPLIRDGSSVGGFTIEKFASETWLELAERWWETQNQIQNLGPAPDISKTGGSNGAIAYYSYNCGSSFDYLVSKVRTLTGKACATTGSGTCSTVTITYVVYLPKPTSGGYCLGY